MSIRILCVVNGIRYSIQCTVSFLCFLNIFPPHLKITNDRDIKVGFTAKHVHSFFIFKFDSTAVHAFLGGGRGGFAFPHNAAAVHKGITPATLAQNTHAVRLMLAEVKRYFHVNVLNGNENCCQWWAESVTKSYFLSFNPAERYLVIRAILALSNNVMRQ